MRGFKPLEVRLAVRSPTLTFVIFHCNWRVFPWVLCCKKNRICGHTCHLMLNNAQCETLFRIECVPFSCDEAFRASPLIVPQCCNCLSVLLYFSFVRFLFLFSHFSPLLFSPWTSIFLSSA